jgi:hypothetical protein
MIMPKAMNSILETGSLVSFALILLLAVLAPKIRQSYLNACNRMREAALKRQSKSKG